MMQLDLWTQSEKDESSGGLAVGTVFEASVSWADDDTSPLELQRLRDLLVGKLQVSDWRRRPVFFYRVTDTRIEEDRIIATCVVADNPFGSQWRGTDEEEDEL